MPCFVKKCKNKSKINSVTGLCPSCDKSFQDIYNRNQYQYINDQENRQSLPVVNLEKRMSSYEKMSGDFASVDTTSKVLKNMFGLMIHLHAKNQGIENVKKKQKRIEKCTRSTQGN